MKYLHSIPGPEITTQLFFGADQETAVTKSKRMKSFQKISRYSPLSLIAFTSSSTFISFNEEEADKKWVFDTKVAL
jgi:hypothetical protein